MTIEFLNDERTEAIITRGLLWWKRRAHVKWESARWADEHKIQHISSGWYYLGTEERLEESLVNRVERAATGVRYKREAERKASNWKPVKDIETKLPAARLLERKS